MNADDIMALRQRTYNTSVAWIKRVHSDLMVIRVPPDYPLPAHKPGQYSTLGLGHWEARHPECQAEEDSPKDDAKLIRRAYSISCSILDEQGKLLDRQGVNWLEFYIVLVREAAKAPGLTPRLFLLKEGD